MTTTPKKPAPTSAPTEQDTYLDHNLIAFKWASTLSEGEQSVLLTRNIKALQDLILAALQAERERTRAEIKCKHCGGPCKLSVTRQFPESAQLPQGKDK